MRRRESVKAAVATVVIVTLLAFAGGQASAVQPDSPPGQGDCEHGNSGQECRPDPQPDHGQDCDEHGPFEGGVNEDHCLGGDPSTPPNGSPSPAPSVAPSVTPSVPPSVAPSTEPSLVPSPVPSESPYPDPSCPPSASPTTQPWPPSSTFPGDCIVLLPTPTPPPTDTAQAPREGGPEVVFPAFIFMAFVLIGANLVLAWRERK